jgi:hypothetical protein
MLLFVEDAQQGIRAVLQLSRVGCLANRLEVRVPIDPRAARRALTPAAPETGRETSSGALQQRHRLHVGRVREHVDRPSVDEPVAEVSRQLLYVPGKRRRIA